MEDEIPPSSGLAKRHKGINGVATLLDRDELDNTAKWFPIYKIYQYSDSKGKDMLVLNVLMPTGVGEKFTHRLQEEDTVMELSAWWPSEMYDTALLYKPIMKQFLLGTNLDKRANHSLKCNAMNKEMRKMTDFHGTDIKSTTRIPLPRQVTGDPDAALLVGKTGSLILELDMLIRVRDNNGLRFGTGLTRK